MIGHINHWLTFILACLGVGLFVICLFATEVVRLRYARRRRARDKIKRMEKENETWIEDWFE